MPAGPHTLTVNYKEGSGLLAFYGHGQMLRADAMHIGQNFLPGHTYQLMAQKIGSSINLSLTEAPAVKGGK
jgi:hypothetical protein